MENPWQNLLEVKVPQNKVYDRDSLYDKKILICLFSQVNRVGIISDSVRFINH